MTTCKICEARSDHAFSLESGTLDIYLCRNCGLLFVRTSIKEDDLKYNYGSNPDLDEYYYEINGTVNEKATRAVQNIVPLLDKCENPAHCSVLDIGCGYGHFLDSLRKARPGVSAAGSEVPGNSASVCRSKGHRIFENDLIDIKERYFIIVLLDVIEHVPSPNSTLNECHSLLHPGGYIYIHTPRRCFWDSFFLALTRIPLMRRLSTTWLRTRLSLGHLQLWTDKSLDLLLHKCGFEKIYLKADLDLSWPLDKYIREYLWKGNFPHVLLKLVTVVAKVVFINLGTLKNKAICLAQKKPDNKGESKT